MNQMKYNHLSWDSYLLDFKDFYQFKFDVCDL